MINLLPAQQELRVMSFNIRYNTPKDGVNAWPLRKDLVTDQIRNSNIHLLGVQEAMHDQLLDMQERLPQYRYVGVGRDDGYTGGEFSAIFYDTTRITVLESETFWLSETPGRPGSKSWDAALPRIATYIKARDKQTLKEFYFFNTHFDHLGEKARAQSATLLLGKINQKAGTLPTILTGDLNAHPDDKPVKTLVDPNNPLHVFDTRDLSTTEHKGPNGTFNGFVPETSSRYPIDYIFVSKPLKVLSHTTLVEFPGGKCTSDHYPVLATIIL